MRGRGTGKSRSRSMGHGFGAPLQFSSWVRFSFPCYLFCMRHTPHSALRTAFNTLLCYFRGGLFLTFSFCWLHSCSGWYINMAARAAAIFGIFVVIAFVPAPMVIEFHFERGVEQEGNTHKARASHLILSPQLHVNQLLSYLALTLGELEQLNLYKLQINFR